ncbi:hypothetical protein AAFF_G00261860 [Aldrovandia affinis]|uniref:Uncharacterized protein n=1 Tax=Aldrovandia affinis TaxID=143900 RepID=A0AAD7RBM7_9TELE|nr:hypothetical protein AAFF_G00261860 [Aldrovandia affinis]
MVFRKVFKLRWVTLKEGWNANVRRSNAAFRTQLTALLDKVLTMYPSRTDWLQIQATRQNTGEMCDDYHSRMEDCFQKHSGLAVDNPAHGNLLKTSVSGLLPHLKDKVMASCVGWEHNTTLVVWEHVQAARSGRIRNLTRIPGQSRGPPATRICTSKEEEGEGEENTHPIHGAARLPHNEPSSHG